MMESVGIAYRSCGQNSAISNLREKQPAIIPQSKRIAAEGIIKDSRTLVGTHGGQHWIRPFHPRFDGEVLQLEVRRVTNIYSVSAAIKNKGLTDSSRAEGGVADQRSIVSTCLIQGIGFSFPPAHNTRGNRNARTGGIYTFTSAVSVVNGLDFTSRE